MKKTIGLLIIAATLTARSGELISKAIQIPSGATNATEEITLNRSEAWDAVAIDAIIYRNDGGSTGTLTFAAADLDVARSLGDAVTAAPATSGTAYPVRAYTAGGATNLAPYYARTLRISIVQASTNANTYTVGVITR